MSMCCNCRKGNGLAFDRVAAETMSDGRKLPCGLKFVLNAALEPARNITPAHEFFHLYQYGYAVFKQKWYLEGNGAMDREQL